MTVTTDPYMEAEMMKFCSENLQLTMQQTQDFLELLDDWLKDRMEYHEIVSGGSSISIRSKHDL